MMRAFPGDWALHSSLIKCTARTSEEPIDANRAVHITQIPAVLACDHFALQ